MFSWWRCSTDNSDGESDSSDGEGTEVAASPAQSPRCPATGATPLGGGSCPVLGAGAPVSAVAGERAPDLKTSLSGKATASPSLGQAKLGPTRTMLADLPEVDDIPMPPAIQAELDVCNNTPHVKGLSEEDIVVVKGACNRTVAWKDMLMEAVLYRWIRLCPEVHPLIEPFFSEVPHDLFTIIDGSVRRLDMRTEVHHRESYAAGFPLCDKRDFGSAPGEILLHYTFNGLRPSHWLELHTAFMWAMRTHNPYMHQAHDGADLESGEGGAVSRFFQAHVVSKAHHVFTNHLDKYTQPAALVVRRQAADMEHHPEVGIEFYKALLTNYPDLQDYFTDADMDSQVRHLHGTLTVVGGAGVGLLKLLSTLCTLAKQHKQAMVPTSSYEQVGEVLVEVLRKFYEMEDEHTQFWVYSFLACATVISKPMAVEERLLIEAREFFERLAKEQEWSPARLDERMSQVAVEVGLTGTYAHTTEELRLGARMAWRNSPKCIGRIAWDTLQVRDRRHVTHAEEIFEECKEHMRLGANGGIIQSLMTVFAPRRPSEKWGTRFWNSQFCRYAGYKQPDGTILGDPANADFTEMCINKLGWRPPQKRTRFDPLPQVIQLPHAKAPMVFDVPRELFMEIPLSHPKFPKFANLGLKWTSIPAITNFNFRLGGVDYPCCPFNGWFCDLEIARNLVERYDIGPKVAQVCGYDTSTDSTGWRSMVLQSTACAVTHSFQKAKTSIVDHYSVSNQFLTHVDRERRCGREVPAQWSWIGGFAGVHCPVWGYEMRDFYLRPQYHYCADRWAVDGWHEETNTDEAQKESEDTVHCPGVMTVLVLFSSTTGTSERFARSISAVVGAGYRPQVMNISSFSEAVATRFSHIICCASTFDGRSPLSGRNFPSELPFRLVNSSTRKPIRYAVLALGSSIYPKFCAFGRKVYKALGEAGGVPFCACVLSDETKGHEASFKKFCSAVSVELPKKPPPPGMKDPPELSVSLRPDPDGSSDTQAAPSVVRGHARARVESVEVIFDNDAEERSTHRVCIDISGCEGMTYTTGGHLSVLPYNPHDEILRLCDAMGIPREQVHWKVDVMADDGVEKFPVDLGFGGSSLYEALKWHVDISVRPATLGVLLGVVKAAGGISEAECKELLSKEHDTVGRFWWVSNLLNQYPRAKGKINPATLLTSLGKQFPRVYSISSSSVISPTVVEVVVGLVCVQHHRGLASGMLMQMGPGSPVWISTNDSSFRLPDSPEAPLIMAAAGTGVAPFLAFTRERMHNLKKSGRAPGRAALFSGFRRGAEAIHPQEFEQALADGALSLNSVSLTREPGLPRETIVDALRNSAALVWELLQNPACHYYCCGDAKMADAAHDALLSAIVKQAHMSRVKAMKVIDQMRLEGRYNLDVWGVVSHGKNAQAVSQKKTLSKLATQWLQSVEDSEVDE